MNINYLLFPRCQCGTHRSQPRTYKKRAPQRRRGTQPRRSGSGPATDDVADKGEWKNNLGREWQERELGEKGGANRRRRLQVEWNRISNPPSRTKAALSPLPTPPRRSLAPPIALRSWGQQHSTWGGCRLTCEATPRALVPGSIALGAGFAPAEWLRGELGSRPASPDGGRHLRRRWAENFVSLLLLSWSVLVLGLNLRLVCRLLLFFPQICRAIVGALCCFGEKKCVLWKNRTVAGTKRE